MRMRHEKKFIWFINLWYIWREKKWYYHIYIHSNIYLNLFYCGKSPWKYLDIFPGKDFSRRKKEYWTDMSLYVHIFCSIFSFQFLWHFSPTIIAIYIILKRHLWLIQTTTFKLIAIKYICSSLYMYTTMLYARWHFFVVKFVSLQNVSQPSMFWKRRRKYYYNRFMCSILFCHPSLPENTHFNRVCII